MDKSIKLAVLSVFMGLSCVATASTLPENLEWISNMNEPLFASEQAKRGGTFRSFMASFPQTLRSVGPDANSGLRHYFMDGTPKLAARHPPIPESGFLNWLKHGRLAMISKRSISN